jgi:hypothetical protein
MWAMCGVHTCGGQAKWHKCKSKVWEMHGICNLGLNWVGQVVMMKLGRQFMP